MYSSYVTILIHFKIDPAYVLCLISLSCAFPNTPKFVQVQKSKQGIIVNKQWILDCHEKSQFLSESNYQFDGTKKSESSTRKSTKVLNFDDENEDDAENQTTSTTMKTTSSRSVEPKRPSRKQIETFDDQDDSSSDEEPKRKLDSNGRQEKTS